MRSFPGKVCAISNIAPFPSEPIDFSKKQKELLWLGRMTFDDKRPDFMLRIWELLQDRFPDWKLRFVGDGKYLPELKKLSTSLVLKRVSFEGFQDPAPHYRATPIFCMTSAQDGFPLVLLEAQALGCIPVAVDSFSSVHDIIEDGVSGVLVPMFDVEKYAEGVSELMLDPELRERIARNAQNSVSRLSAESIGDAWEKILREVVVK